MTKIRKQFPILFIISFLQLQCASVPVYRLEPVEMTSEWYYGRPVLSKGDSILNIHVTFEDAYENNYYFYIEAANTSDKSLTINPADIYLENIILFPDSSLLPQVKSMHTIRNKNSFQSTNQLIRLTLRKIQEEV